MDRLNLGQRIVLVVALAVILRTLGSYIVNRNRVDGGWFAYAPNTDAAFEPVMGWDPLGSALLWMVLTFLWAAVSLWLLSSARARSGNSTDEG